MTGLDDNPLREVGVPLWLVQQAIKDGPEAMDRLRRHIGHIARVASRTYHPDVLPLDPRGSYKRLTDAAAALTTVEEIEAWAGFLIDPDSMNTDEYERLKALAAKREAAKWQALLDMLYVVDQFQVARVAGKSELLFGLPMLDGNVALTYDSSFVLHLDLPDRTKLTELCPDEGLIMSFDEGATWDAEAGAWRVSCLSVAAGYEAPEYATHHHRYRGETVSVQLVGGVPAGPLPGLYELAYPVQDDLSALPGPGPLGLRPAGSYQSSRLHWFSPDKAWWMEALRPELHFGDYGVVMRRSTGELALAGRLLARRSLYL